MSRALESIEQRRFSIEEYHRMGEAGILGPDERVELVRGIVRRMSPKGRAHVIVSDLIASLFRDALQGKASVYQEAPLAAAGIDSEPEPDVMVCSNPDRSAYGTSRTKPLLVIEVADASLAYDRGEKAGLYPEAGVPEYWVVNLLDGSVEVFREPDARGYRSRSVLGREERVAPQAWPDLELPVSALFPRGV